MFHWYLSLCLKNMHSVEDTLISHLYQKAEALGVLAPNEMRIFYYTRRSFIGNMCEMMGSTNPWRWVVPLPYFGRQNHSLEGTEDLQYMRLDRDAIRNLEALEYQVELYMAGRQNDIYNYRIAYGYQQSSQGSTTASQTSENVDWYELSRQQYSKLPKLQEGM
ncbi:hypothetical protein FGO68_gene17051 [Halteria grandinella]|uniref:Uncharacterized protein n=1 Tax=Halteria grandinella TaxID=5974 RepID=A0A8J8T8U2_HALGN|nr:hypothetical protein FGO68_gene17051 [Halteria grandinella]